MTTDDASMNETDAGITGASRGLWLRTLLVLAFSFMLYQIGILRELRFQLSAYYTLAPFLFSAVVVLIGLGSFAAKPIKNSVPWLKGAMLLLPVIFMPAYGMMIYIARTTINPEFARLMEPSLRDVDPRIEHLDSIALPFLLAALLGYGIVFFMQGFVFALFFREGRKSGVLSNVYAVDLIASGVGALAGGIMVYFTEPITTAIVASTVMLLNLVLSRRLFGISVKATAIAAVVCLGISGAQMGTDFLNTAAGPEQEGLENTYSAWSPYRRIDVLENDQALVVHTDSLPFHLYNKADDERWNPVSIPIEMIPTGGKRKVLVIGAGTGSDVSIIKKLHPENLEIVAIELDEGFLEATKQVPYLSKNFEGTRVEISEGRYFVEKTDEKFDAIIFAYIDPQSAVSSIGVPDANFLYTSRGIRAAYECLKPGGLMVVTRFYLVDQQEEFLQRVSATLRDAELDEVSLIYRFGQAFTYGYFGRVSILQVYLFKDAPVVGPTSNRVVHEPLREGGRPTTDNYPFS